MKKMVLLLLFGSFLYSTVLAENVISMLPNPDLVITIRINLHRKSDCKTGFGFCRVSIGISWDEKTPGVQKDLPAQAYLNSSNDLVVKIAESALREYEDGRSLSYFIGKDKIILTENYEIGEDVSKALGSSTPLVIKAGEYKITNDQGYFIMVFPQ